VGQALLALVDDAALRVRFQLATGVSLDDGVWLTPSTFNGWIIPKHLLKDNVGPNAKNAPFNLKPLGTGPYMVQEFKPGDVLTFVPNPNYRDANKPFFSEIDIKGGGDAPSAARAIEKASHGSQ